MPPYCAHHYSLLVSLHLAERKRRLRCGILVGHSGHLPPALRQALLQKGCAVLTPEGPPHLLGHTAPHRPRPLVRPRHLLHSVDEGVRPLRPNVGHHARAHELAVPSVHQRPLDRVGSDLQAQHHFTLRIVTLREFPLRLLVVPLVLAGYRRRAHPEALAARPNAAFPRPGPRGRRRCARGCSPPSSTEEEDRLGPASAAAGSCDAGALWVALSHASAGRPRRWSCAKHSG
mmetsp:Transcript_16775/g.36488  ORF Transcript_16775/g.36488 Transcript_16775/m.36488 type:complete len:231 (+) Transcript_16775:1615-2307(+)